MRTRTVVAISVLLLAAMLMVMAQSSNETESNAIGVMRSINTAEAFYAKTYTDAGFACDLASLGPDAKGGTSQKAANLLDASVTRGKEKNGYYFKVECKGKSKPQTEYRSSAVPAKKGTGRAFCSDQTGVIRYSTDGEAKSCFEHGQMVK